MPIFYERELEFRYANVHPLNLDGSSMDVTVRCTINYLYGLYWLIAYI
jgi:hypothetical protein